MKKVLVLLAVCTVVFAFEGCKKYDFSDLKYTDISAYDWLQVNVVKKDGGEKVCWFQVFDQVNEKSTIETYKKSQTKVDNFPANINDNKWIWIMVNDRIEIRLLADENSKYFQDTAKLKNFILSFDLEGMERIKGDKLAGQDLMKYIPKLDK